MRKSGMSITALGLAVAGLVAPAGTAQASGAGTTANHCNTVWPGRDGRVYAFDEAFCYGQLGKTAGNDADWNANAAGEDFANAWDKASSVMNAGTEGNLDVVKFYYWQDYGRDHAGYNCLDAGEFFVDDLSRNKFTNGYGMNNSIRSHKWVNSGDCNGNFMH
ncbi:hypothetical protein OG462_26800 [Streptomyces sp. NBC_01077]|uniref:hypothetical protein n=1 Tax=Streptomyces sp. NBC_01077 TaxID=2903746 RepID=UPI00386A389D|nr:hypothetical protein OG462_26800 [Streptomyces sp. NBC_01077]